MLIYVHIKRDFRKKIQWRQEIKEETKNPEPIRTLKRESAFFVFRTLDIYLRCSSILAKVRYRLMENDKSVRMFEANYINEARKCT